MVAPRRISAADVFPLSAQPQSHLIAGLGDSITALATSVNTAGNYQGCIGFLGQVPYLTRQRVRFRPDLNFGVSGQTSVQIAARVADVVAAKPAVCTVMAGTNDSAANGITSAATTIAALASIYDALQRAGIIVIAIPITGRGGVRPWEDQSHRDRSLFVNQWIRSQRLSRPGYFVADATLAFSDPASAIFPPRAGYVDDGLHPNAIGGYAIANQVATIINQIFPDPLATFGCPADVYSATNTTGNLVTNGLMTAAGGSISGATGTVPGSLTLDATGAGGATVVSARNTLADGRGELQVTISGTYNAAFPGIYATGTLNAGNFSVGDTIEASVEMDIAAGNVSLANSSLLIATTQNSVSRQSEDFNNAGSGLIDLMPSAALSGVLRTPPLVLTSAPSSVKVQLRMLLLAVTVSTPVTADIKWRSLELRKI